MARKFGTKRKDWSVDANERDEFDFDFAFSDDPFHVELGDTLSTWSNQWHDTAFSPRAMPGIAANFRFDQLLTDGGRFHSSVDSISIASQIAEASLVLPQPAQEFSFTCGCAACAGPREAAETDNFGPLIERVIELGQLKPFKPVFSLGQIVEQLQTQWRGDSEGDTRTWAGTNISYSIASTTAPDDGDNGEADGFDGAMMTAHKHDMAVLAFELWDDLIAVNLNETTDTDGGIITIAYSSTTDDDGTYARTSITGNGPDHTITQSRIWLNTGWDNLNGDADIAAGLSGFRTYIHEIGHSLGLSHAGSYNAEPGVDITYAANAEYAQDTRQYTVMSYFNAAEYGTADHNADNGSLRHAATPMLHDIAAIQDKYGADMTTRTGNTVYGFNSTAGRAVFDFTVNTNPVIAIWDAGGTDTLDASGFGQDQVIKLAAGSYSSIGALTQNVAIAFNAVIENATGGTGDDEIRGNAVRNILRGGDGSDTMFGLEGNDELYGMEGFDTLVGGSGADRLDGGADTDTASYEHSAVRVTVALGMNGANGTTSEVTTTSTGQFQSATFDTLVSIENVIGSALNDTITGNEIDNTLAGGDGNDTINGGTGNDALHGEDQDDVLSGGAGWDILYGGDGIDTASYEQNGGRVVVTLGEPNLWRSAGLADEYIAGQTAPVSTDTLYHIENVRGSAFADTITGNALDNRLDGRGGADTLQGKGGNDTYVVDNAKDVVTELAAEGSDIVLSTVTYALANNVEKLTLLEEGGAVNGTGNALANQLHGNSAVNSLYGGGDNDSLWGEAGNDHLFGDAGGDYLTGGAGTDRLTGGTGADRFIFKTVDECFTWVSSGGVFGLMQKSYDKIVDFSSADGDKINLANIDANSVAPGHQMFDFIGAAAFSGTACELRYADGFVQGDVDGNGGSDFRIEVGVANLTVNDFILSNMLEFNFPPDFIL